MAIWMISFATKNRYLDTQGIDIARSHLNMVDGENEEDKVCNKPTHS